MIQCRKPDGTVTTHQNHETCPECEVPMAGDRVGEPLPGRYLSSHVGHCPLCDQTRCLDVRAAGHASEITVCPACRIVVSVVAL